MKITINELVLCRCVARIMEKYRHKLFRGILEQLILMSPEDISENFDEAHHFVKI
jgi:hypothetical protein